MASIRMKVSIHPLTATNSWIWIYTHGRPNGAGNGPIVKVRGCDRANVKVSSGEL